MQLRHARPLDAKPPTTAEPRHEDEGEWVMMRHMHHLLGKKKSRRCSGSVQALLRLYTGAKASWR